MAPRVSHRLSLTEKELARAITLWRMGKDTYDIAKELKVHESQVFNSLREWREKQRTAA